MMGKLKKIDGPQKAAIFLMAMGDEFTRTIFRGLTDHEIKLLGRRMAALEDVTIPVDAVQNIMDEFQQLSGEVKAHPRLHIPGHGYCGLFIASGHRPRNPRGLLKG
jgi:flagellar motor switch protein FliG